MVAEPEQVVYRVGSTFVCGAAELTELIPVAGQSVPGGPSRWAGRGQAQGRLPNGQTGTVQYPFSLEAATVEAAFAGASAARKAAGEAALEAAGRQMVRESLSGKR